MNKTLPLFASAALAVASTASAATLITFADFNSVATGNTANVGGAATNLSISRAGTGAGGDDFVYSFTYANQSFDGDGTMDTLTFDVRVQGLTGGTISSGITGTTSSTTTLGSATIGTTLASVNQTTRAGGSGDSSSRETWTVGNANMDSGETLKFTLENFAVTTSTGTYGATLGQFKTVFSWESGGNTHQTVIGSGTGLTAKNWSNNRNSDHIINNVNQSPILYVSQGNDTGPSGYNLWGLEHIDFTVNVDAIPEPSSAALLGLGAFGLLIRRRR